MITPRLDKDKGHIVGYVKTVVAITAEDIENIIVTAFEGGSNYWMGLIKNADWCFKPAGEPTSLWATRLLLEGKAIPLCDKEKPEEVFMLTLENLLSGIKQSWEEHPSSWDKENWDAVDCDCILQYALFGEIVFG